MNVLSCAYTYTTSDVPLYILFKQAIHDIYHSYIVTTPVLYKVH